LNTILYLFISALSIRLVSLYISIRNEKQLKANGAVEYGKANSLILTLSHVAFYGSALVEMLIRRPSLNYITGIGMLVFAFSMLVLFAVIHALGSVWTVKLIISPQQVVIKSFLFRIFRHPNYFLNIIPELIGIALLCQSFITLFIGLPLYLIPLTIRIRQEESIMRNTFADY
jgi:isoprenylcysteine carboxyl methyltransferase (ICMT) family protein YpbQ